MLQRHVLATVRAYRSFRFARRTTGDDGVRGKGSKRVSDMYVSFMERSGWKWRTKGA